MRRLIQMVRAWRARRREEQEMAEEFQFHLDQATERHRRRGMSREEARRAALIEFGGVEGHKETARDDQPTRWIENAAQDLRYAFRTLGRQPGFTTAVVLTMTLSIGATTAMFSVVNGVLLRPLPFPESGSIAFVGWDFGKGRVSNNLTGFQVEFLRERSELIEALATFVPLEFDLGAPGTERVVRGLQVSDDFFGVVGLGPALGRVFAGNEQLSGGPDVVIVSDAMWRSEFGADPAILGRTVRVGDRLHRIVGVMPAGFQFPSAPDHIGILVPMRFRPDRRDEGHNFEAIARVAGGGSRSTLAVDLSRAGAAFRLEHPDLVQDANEGFVARTFSDLYAGDLRTTLWVLFAAVASLLLIGCANAANLVLARSMARSREIVLRTAIGAGRGRIVRQLLTEGLALAAIAGALGTVAGLWGVRLLMALAPRALPRAQEIGLDWRVLALALGAIMASGLVFGLVAGLPARRLSLASALGARWSGGSSRLKFRGALLVGQTAVAAVMLVCAGLLAASFFHLRQLDPGFDPADVLTVRIPKLPASYSNASRQVLETALLDRVRRLPGVEAAGMISSFPLERGVNLPVSIEGRPERAEGSVELRAVSPGTLEALRLRLLAGRLLDQGDVVEGVHRAVVSETFARHFFPDANPIGQRIEINRYKGQWFGGYRGGTEIIGVVGDVRDRALTRAPRWTVYAPIDRGESSSPRFVVRARHHEPVQREIERVVAAETGNSPALVFRPLPELVAGSIAPQRYAALIVLTFAGGALLLTVIGTAGVLGYSVHRARHETGIRVALGARPAAIIGTVVGRGMRWVVVGTGIGITITLSVTRFLESMLFGVTAREPAVFLAGAVVLVTTALVACMLPAVRAARVDPVIALRNE
jgi:predicted permease